VPPIGPEDSWPPKPLNKSHIAAIGKVVIEWAYLETKIDESIWLLLGRPETSQFNANLDIAFDRRMRLWKDLLPKISQNKQASQ